MHALCQQNEKKSKSIKNVLQKKSLFDIENNFSIENGSLKKVHFNQNGSLLNNNLFNKNNVQTFFFIPLQ